MKKRHFLATALIALFILITGFLAPSYAVQTAGDSSLQLSGSFTRAKGASTGVLNLDAGYGYFFSDKLEAGILQTLAYSFIEGRDDDWVASTIPFLNFHFRGLSANDSFQPFIGAFIGASYNDNDTTGTIGPQAGFKSFVNDSTFILVKYRYEWFFDDLTMNDIDETKSEGTHVGTVGLGFIF